MWSLTLIVLAALGVGIYVYVNLDDEIRSRVQQKLAAHYPELNVAVRRARLLEGRGIEIRGLVLAERSAVAGQPAEMLTIDEIVLVCSPTVEDLIHDRIQVERVVVHRPRLRIVRNEAQWNVASLLPPPKFGSGAPEIVIEDATVEFVQPLAGQASPLTLREVHLKLNPQVSTDPADAGRRQYALAGSLGGELVERIDVQGRFDPASQAWQLGGTAEGLEIGPELLARLPTHWHRQLRDLGTFRAQGKLQFQISSQPDRQPAEQYHVSCELTRGRLDNPYLPYPLTDLESQLRCDNGLVVVDRFTARSGPVRIDASGERSGLGPNDPLRLVARARKVLLEPEMAGRLPPTLRTHWDKYRPEGQVDVDLRLEFDGRSWKPDLEVHFQSVAFRYHKFPYRLERAKGKLAYRDDKLRVDLNAYSGQAPIAIQGEVIDPGPRAKGWVEVQGRNVAIENRIIDALPPGGQKVVRDLKPAGEITFQWRLWRDDPRIEKLRSRLLLSLNGCSIQYARFPYPLANIRGDVEMVDGRWTFRDLKGTNDMGLVTCNGEMNPTPQGNHLVLSFTGAGVPLEEELRDALSPAAQRMWNDLQPRGRIDLAAEARYLSSSNELGLDVRIEPVGEGTSIEPASFPYRMENLQGTVTYRDGQVELAGIRARHGPTRLATRGRCEIRPDGAWQLQLEDLNVDQLRADRDLLSALPPGLRRAVVQLNPTGRINMRGSLGLSRADRPDSPLHTRWDLDFTLHQAAFDCGLDFTGVHGGIRLAGSFDGSRFLSKGELSIDSLNYRNMQLTEVAGPMRIDNERVLMGVWAENDQGRGSRHLTAKFCGGTIVGDGWAALAPTPRFALQATLSEGDLKRFAMESLGGSQKLNGKVLASVEIHGTPRGLHTLGGSGNLQLRQADLYELPVIVQLLKVLRVRAPDATAFTESNMHFRIDGEHLYFDQLDFVGDAVSLYGKGEMNFNKEVKLTFHSIVGRNDLPLPLLQKMVGQASEQIMQIHVRGTLESPQITSEALPAVNQVLQQFQADLRGAGQPPPNVQDPWGWLRPRGPVPEVPEKR